MLKRQVPAAWPVVVVALVCFPASTGWTQSTSGRAPAGLAVSPIIVGSGSDTRVSAGPGIARCRTLLEEIARLGRVDIRNLERVPEAEMYVDFTATPLASVLSAVLDHAKVDFALRAGNASLPVMAVVFGPSSQPGQRSTKAAPPSPQDMRSETAAPSNSELVMTDRLAPLDLEVPAVELPELERNVEGTHRSVSVPFERRPVIQLPQIPVWRPLVTAPMQMSVQMVPKSGPVTAPPADPNAAARTPGPPSPVKRQ